MKKYAFFFLLITVLHSLSAQPDTTVIADTVKSLLPPSSENKQSLRLPVKGDMGFTLNMIGLLDTISIGSFKDFSGNNFLLMRYYLDNQTALRTGFGFNLDHSKIAKADSAGASLILQDSAYKRTDFYFSPGYEKHFLSGKNLDPYIALAVQIGKIGRTKIKSKTTTIDTLGTSINDITYTMEGGFLLGANLGMGFNYFISEKLSIGAEYGLGINTSRVGGDWTRVMINTPASGSQTVKTEKGSLSISGTKLKMNSNAGIMLSYFF